MNRSQSFCFRGIITISFFLFLHPLLNTFASPPTRSRCRPDQRDALLELKKEFRLDATRFSWNKSVDCCSWEGVTCDAILGKVISLELPFTDVNTSLKSSSALFKLQHLRHLEISNCNLQGEIPSSIGNISHLTFLDFSNNQLVGEVPVSIGNLSHLTHLDLSSNQLVGEVPVSIGNLNQLRYMSLGGNDFSGNFPISAFNLTKHLRFLDLSGCNLHGEIPTSVGNLFNLRVLKLSFNKFSGNIPSSFANLTKLETLSLESNQFTGGGIVLANLTNLSYIDLSYNNFTSFFFADLSGLQNLEGFYGNDNSFIGFFPSSLLTNPSLAYIHLKRNQFEGTIDFGNTSSLSHLRELDIGYNNFDGLITKSISKLRSLVVLDLSHNNFVGRVPRSLSKLVNLTFLDLSYNKLEGEVPPFFWTSSKLMSTDLSHNSFGNFGKSVEVVDGASLRDLDLGSNSLQGPIPHWICKLSLLGLVLSSNHFTGSIPQCLKSSTSLMEVNLRHNSLSGFLPDFCTNKNSQLQLLDVSHNYLKGKLPKSLMNCTSMELLNVKGNKIKDKFPFWLGSLTVLLLGSNAFYGPVYNSSAYLGFPNLSIIDISNNNFVGSLPQDCFANWTGISSSSNEYGSFYYYMGDFRLRFVYSMEMVYKRVDMDFDRIVKDFKAIDFSGNRFSGDIPSSIGLLSELRLLNLSGNAFTGNIPPSLANITMLETLDLSRNNLSGKIPPVLGNLTFLSNINFSHNHLEGLVPQSTQFDSQKCSSFVGNPKLYGLEKICEENHVPVPTPQQPEESSSEPEEQMVNWIAAAIAYGPGVFCGLVIGHIFTSYKHEWFMQKFGRNKGRFFFKY